ncbi:MAG: c-type cytochrome biogenesis protein CcmI [Pseudomonadota bacterium]
MTVFLMISITMVALTLFFVLPSLLRKESTQPTGKNQNAVQRDALNLEILRDQLRELNRDFQLGTVDDAGYQSARQELERRIAKDVHATPLSAPSIPAQRWTAFVIALAIPATAAGLYYFLGTPSALNPTQIATKTEQNPPVTAQQIEGMVANLAKKLKSNPNDANGWRMLARSYETMRRFDDAVDAYKHLLQLTPNDADVLVNYAVTLAMSTNRDLSGEPEKLINRALTIDPNNVEALALLGSVAFEKKDYAGAIVSWKKILTLVPAETDIARTITSSIAKAEILIK